MSDVMKPAVAAAIRGEVRDEFSGRDAFQPGYFGQVARVSSVRKLQDHHCRFPIDLAGGGTGFCGALREKDGSYCSHHAGRCYREGAKKTLLRQKRGLAVVKHP